MCMIKLAKDRCCNGITLPMSLPHNRCLMSCVTRHYTVSSPGSSLKAIYGEDKACNSWTTWLIRERIFKIKQAVAVEELPILKKSSVITYISSQVFAITQMKDIAPAIAALVKYQYHFVYLDYRHFNVYIHYNEIDI